MKKFFTLILISFFVFGCMQNQDLLKQDLKQKNVDSLSNVFSPATNELNLFDLCFVQANKCIKIEKAISLEEHIKGLSFRKSLPENNGMLFISQEEYLPKFWMHGMEFPLDIVWISKDKKIVGWEEKLPICVENEECPIFSPEQEVQFVLEVNAGFMEENKIQIGETVEFN